ncbi:MAG TPA: MFS transporter [Stellaceae bacterium]|nr:MFS transporter [Stellaceae bacterium]
MPTQLVVGWLTMFVVGTDLFVVSPMLDLIARDYHISPAAAGSCVTIFSLVYAASAPLFGHLADRLGRRRVLSCALAGFAAANLLTASAASFPLLLAARLMAGTAAAAVSPAVYALVSSAAPPQRRATALAIAVSGLLVSLVLGAPLGALAAGAIGWAPVFVALAFLSLLLVWPNSRIWPRHNGDAALARRPHHPLAATALAWRLVPMVLWSAGLYGMYTYLGSGLAALGLSSAEIAGAISLYGCGAIAGILFGGRMADRFGARATAAAGLFGLALCLIALRLALAGGMLLAVVLTVTSAVAQLFFPAQQAGLARDFPARRASALAWNNSALFIGIMLGSALGGRAVAIAGFPADLTICAGLALLGSIVSGVVVPGAARPRTDSAKSVV